MSVFVFNYDFSGNWKKGQHVTCEIREDGVLVDNVALIDFDRLIEVGFFLNIEPKAVGVSINGTFVYDREMSAGDIVQHYNGGLYKILAYGTHTETLEAMVVYQSLSDRRVWVRSYLEFASPIDKYTHPEALHPYRFVKVKIND